MKQFFAELRVTPDASRTDEPSAVLFIRLEALDFPSAVALLHAFGHGISAASTNDCLIEGVSGKARKGHAYLEMGDNELWTSIDRMVDPEGYDSPTTMGSIYRGPTTLAEYAKKQGEEE